MRYTQVIHEIYMMSLVDTRTQVCVKVGTTQDTKHTLQYNASGTIHMDNTSTLCYSRVAHHKHTTQCSVNGNIHT